MSTVSDRIETSVVQIGESAEVASQFIDPSNTSEIVREQGSLKPLGLIQQEADEAIARIAHFKEEAWVAGQEYTEKKIYFIHNGIAYNPVVIPYTAGSVDIQTDINSGLFTVLQGLVMGDLGGASTREVGKRSNELPKGMDVEVVFSTLMPSEDGDDAFSANLTVGQLIRTKGYWVAGDLGAARYRVEYYVGVGDLGSIISLGNGLGLRLLEGEYVSPHQFGAKGGDPGYDDRPALLDMFLYMTATGVKGELHNVTYYIMNNLWVADGVKGFQLYGRAGSVIKRNSDFNGSTFRVVNTDDLILGNFEIDSNEGEFAGSDIGLDIVSCSDSVVYRVKVRNTGGNGMWGISGKNEITFSNFHFIQCQVFDIGNSGIQLQGCSSSGIQACSAFRVDVNENYQGTGIYFKNPCRDSYMDNCYVEDAVNGFSIGTGYAGEAIADSIQYSNLRAINVDTGLRYIDSEDCLCSGLRVKIRSDGDVGLGDAVRFENGSKRCSVLSIKAEGVRSFRGAVRFFGDASSNNATITSFINPAPDARLIGFSSDSDENFVTVSKGFQIPEIVCEFSSTGEGNAYKILGVPRSQGEEYLKDGVLSLEDRTVGYVYARPENSVDDILHTITPGIDGRRLTITNFISSALITLNDSDNLMMSTQTFILSGQRDSITFIWSDRNNAWVELSRSKNL